ncbi:hypothetical protein VN12_00415 [Pirellula sp. SH-Sr6A]|nr:hypothetical protein VN12_00415 [Pirellula sp. SH-Sr6A]
MLASFYSMVRIAQSHKDLYFAGLLTTQDIEKSFLRKRVNPEVHSMTL